MPIVHGNRFEPLGRVGADDVQMNMSYGACWDLGKMYANGEGVTQDYARAASLYQQACDGGMATVCNNLGVMYLRGEGVTQDYTRAVSFFQKACDRRGYAEALEEDSKQGRLASIRLRSR